MHMDDANYLNETGIGWYGINMGSCTLQTTKKKYGAASIFINGDKGLLLPNIGYLIADFTIEFFYNNNGFDYLLGNAAQDINFSSNALKLANTTVIASGLALGTGSNTTFRHMAITRSGSTVRVFDEGVLKGTGTSSASINFSAVYLGAYPGQGVSTYNCIDEFRLSSKCLYTAGFTPPSEAFTYTTNDTDSAQIFDDVIPV